MRCGTVLFDGCGAVCQAGEKFNAVRCGGCRAARCMIYYSRTVRCRVNSGYRTVLVYAVRYGAVRCGADSNMRCGNNTRQRLMRCGQPHAVDLWAKTNGNGQRQDACGAADNEIPVHQTVYGYTFMRCGRRQTFLRAHTDSHVAMRMRRAHHARSLHLAVR